MCALFVPLSRPGSAITGGQRRSRRSDAAAACLWPIFRCAGSAPPVAQASAQLAESGKMKPGGVVRVLTSVRGPGGVLVHIGGQEHTD